MKKSLLGVRQERLDSVHIGRIDQMEASLLSLLLGPLVSQEMTSHGTGRKDLTVFCNLEAFLYCFIRF